MAIITREGKDYITTKDGLRALDDKKYFEEKKDGTKPEFRDVSKTVLDNKSTGMEKINNFQDYGFEADFRGQVLRDNGKFLIGYITDSTGEYIAEWVKDTGKVNECSMKLNIFEYNLTPIKKPWYGNQDNFPKYGFGRIDIVERPMLALGYNKAKKKIDYGCGLISVDDFRLATKSELMALCTEGE